MYTTRSHEVSNFVKYFVEKGIWDYYFRLLASINATGTRQSPAVGSDIEIWTSDGVPGASLDTESEKYFWYHHSNADTLEAESTDYLDKNTALWASVAYVLADLSIDFPRETT